MTHYYHKIREGNVLNPVKLQATREAGSVLFLRCCLYSAPGFPRVSQRDAEVCREGSEYEGEVITFEDIKLLYESQRGNCALTGLPMHATTDESDLSVSVDRIDNNLGYVLGNVRLVCSRVNLMMSNLDDAHFTWWCRAVVNHIGN